MDLRTIDEKLPYPIQQPLRYIYGAIPARFRLGRVFWETYNFLQESQWWSREKLEEYQMQQLGDLLHHAYENVPYYRRVFNERGLRPKNIHDLDDLKKLPYLTKDIFKQTFDELLAGNVKLKGLRLTHTSGTTGKPLQFYEDPWTKPKERAFIYHQWSRVGVKPDDPMTQLRGTIIQSRKPVYYDPISKVLRLSPRIDSKEIVRYYLEKMQQFGAIYLHGYPSTIGIFASMIKQYGLSVLFKLKAVLFASEAIYSWERQIVKEVFNCRVFSHYGMAEKVVLAGECENSHYYHCLPHYGIAEIDPDTNEIIGTSLLNYVNPFIRYRTTDIGFQPIYSGCGKCNRSYLPIFAKIEGRLEDFIITPRGVPISPAVITHPFKDFETMKGTQILQKSLDYVKVRIVPWDEYDPKTLECELKQIRQGLQRILGPDMRIETEIVESIQLSKSGKFKWITSEVSKDFLQKGIREA